MLTAVLLTVLIVFVISMLVFAPIFGLGSSGSSVICPGVTNTGYKFADRAELLAGIEEWIADKETTKNEYGDINTWDVTAVKDMSFMFGGDTRGVFNDNIGCWDVGSVTVMEGMFLRNTVFNQDIGRWNVSSVTRMGSMFSGATAFNQPIGNWNVGSVTSMGNMFEYDGIEESPAFNQPIGEWNVSSVTDMNSMFSGATAFNQPIGKWNVGNVTNMGYMFNRATSFNQDIGSWNVSNVEGSDENSASNFTGMRSMFNGATSFNQDIGSWKVGKVKNMYEMFNGASSFNQNLTNWNPNVTGNFLYQNMFTGSGISGEKGDWTGGVTTFRDSIETKVGGTGATFINLFYNDPSGTVDLNDFFFGQPTPEGLFPILRRP